MRLFRGYKFTELRWYNQDECLLNPLPSDDMSLRDALLYILVYLEHQQVVKTVPKSSWIIISG